MTQERTIYPALGFYYRVQFGNLSQAPDAAFMEVSGLSVTMQTDEPSQALSPAK